MSAREQLEVMKKGKNSPSGQQQASPSAVPPPAQSVPVPVSLVSVAASAPQGSVMGTTVPAKSAAFKILTFNKLADVFAKLVTANSLDNVFVEGEIEIYVKQDSNENTIDLLSYKENRPMDVLLWEAKRLEGNADDMKFFKVIADSTVLVDSAVYLWNMKAIAFAYLMVMTRGSLPLNAGASAGNKLPNLLTSRLGMPGNSVESDFANRLSRVDLSKIDCKWMLNIDISNIPDPIRNRIAKGTAGSRALKIILAAVQLVPFSESKIGQGLLHQFGALVDIANGGSAYLSLHPLRQQVQSQIPNFYRSCLLMAFMHVGTDKFQELKTNLLKVESFKKDAALSDIVVVGTDLKFGSGQYQNGFEGKSYDQVKALFGNSL